MTKEEIFCKHLGEYVPCELKNVVLTCIETRTILAAVQEFADHEKQALKEKIKRELLTEWTWSDIALMGDVLKKIERL